MDEYETVDSAQEAVSSEACPGRPNPAVLRNQPEVQDNVQARGEELPSRSKLVAPHAGNRTAGELVDSAQCWQKAKPPQRMDTLSKTAAHNVRNQRRGDEEHPGQKKSDQACARSQSECQRCHGLGMVPVRA